jgi:ubiquinone biosynthesis protein
VVTQIQRFSHILEILGKYGFGVALEKLFPIHSRMRFSRPGDSPESSGEYERMRLAIEELGPTFVKFGQIMSTRTDLLLPEMIAELKKLQDHVKPVPFGEIRPIIEASCPNPGKWFREIDETPVASASISQVHRAVLLDGTRVALKIQRPGIGEIIETDLRILASMAERVEQAFPETRVYNPTGMVKDFAHQIRNELDFLKEARTAERMRANFPDGSGIHIPTIYWDYSSSRMLVMEFVEGVRIDNLEELAALGLDPHEIGARGFRAYVKMIFDDGFFHGDPHPGNLLVRNDGTIVVLDFGIAGIIRPKKRRNFINFLFSVIHEDTELMVKSLGRLGVEIPEDKREALQDDLFFLLQDLGLSYTISQFHFALFVNELAEVMRRYHIKVPANLMLILKVLVMILDIGVRLDPEFNIEKELSPYLQEIAEKNTYSVVNAKRISVTFLETLDAILDLPRYLNLTMKRLSTGTIRIDLVERDIQELVSVIDSVSDKLMMGLVVGSLVIGSSLVLRASHQHLRPEISWIAFFGYGLAVLVGFYAIYDVLFLKFRQVR